MNKEQIKSLIINTIDENKDKITEISHGIYENPEFGYKEFKLLKS